MQNKLTFHFDDGSTHCIKQLATGYENSPRCPGSTTSTQIAVSLAFQASSLSQIVVVGVSPTAPETPRLPGGPRVALP